jgi:two-component system response regulator NreC
MAAGPWRVLLADDHLVVRAGLKALLSADPRCLVVGEASSLDELRTAAHHLQPDLIVLDLSFGIDNALDALPALQAEARPPRIIVLTMHDDVAFAREAFARGVHGYLVKESAAVELSRAVEAVMSGATYLHPELGARMAKASTDPATRLSPHERDVLVRLARGHTNAEIARQLLVSLRTVESLRARLRVQLGVSTRAEMVDAAHRMGLLP